MATSVTPPPLSETASIEQRLARLERTSVTAALSTPATSKGRFRSLFEIIGVGVLGGAIFFLGTMYSTVNATAAKVDKLTEAMMSTSRDSLSSRLAVLETRMTAIETKLDSIDKKLDIRLTK